MLQSFWPRGRAWLLVGVALTLVGTATCAEVTLKQIAVPSVATTAPSKVVPAPASPPATAAPAVEERIPEGTEVFVRFDDTVTSATAAAGDTFSISTDEPIKLADGRVIPAGLQGKGEVVEAHKKGMLGKGGELSVRLDYIRIGDARVHLRANKAAEGGSTVTTTVVLTLLITPLFLMHHGHEIVFPKGQLLTAYVDEDALIALPAGPPAG